jgi:hypothetical protein
MFTRHRFECVKEEMKLWENKYRRSTANRRRRISRSSRKNHAVNVNTHSTAFKLPFCVIEIKVSPKQV